MSDTWPRWGMSATCVVVSAVRAAFPDTRIDWHLQSYDEGLVLEPHIEMPRRRALRANARLLEEQTPTQIAADIIKQFKSWQTTRSR